MCTILTPNTSPEVYETLFMLNSADYEIFSVDSDQMPNSSAFAQGLHWLLRLVCLNT